MKIIHRMNTLPCLLDHALAARLRVMPAVMLTGARQAGKSTLVEQLVPGDRRYRSLDDFDVRDAARRDPEALLGGNDPFTLDAEWRDLLATPRKTGRRSRGAEGFPRRRWNSRRRPTAPSGSTATCAPIWNATCRTSPRSPR